MFGELWFGFSWFVVGGWCVWVLVVVLGVGCVGCFLWSGQGGAWEIYWCAGRAGVWSWDRVLGGRGVGSGVGSCDGGVRSQV